jgi:hypothetical protein
MKYTLKAPISERLKLKCDFLLSTSAFKFNLRRYILGSPRTTFTEHDWTPMVEDVAQALEKLAHYVKGVGALHMVPYHELKERCGEHTDDIVAALSALLEAAVRQVLTLVQGLGFRSR